MSTVLLNTSVSTVQKWGIGQKRPTGTALNLLHLVRKRGLEVVDSRDFSANGSALPIDLDRY